MKHIILFSNILLLHCNYSNSVDLLTIQLFWPSSVLMLFIHEPKKMTDVVYCNLPRCNFNSLSTHISRNRSHSLHREGSSSIGSTQRGCKLYKCTCDIHPSRWYQGVSSSCPLFWAESRGFQIMTRTLSCLHSNYT